MSFYRSKFRTEIHIAGWVYKSRKRPSARAGKPVRIFGNSSGGMINENLHNRHSKVICN